MASTLAVPAVVATTPPPVPVVVRRPTVPLVPLPNVMALPAPKIKRVAVQNGRWEFIYDSGTVHVTSDPVEAQMLLDVHFPNRGGANE